MNFKGVLLMAVVVPLLPACKKARHQSTPRTESPAKAAQPGPAKLAPAQCAQRAKELDSWLGELVTSISPVRIYSPRLELVQLAGDRARFVGAMFELDGEDAAELAKSGDPVTTKFVSAVMQKKVSVGMARKAHAAATAGKAPARTAPPDAVPIYVVLDRRTPWHAVMLLATEAVEKGEPTLDFVFLAQDAPPPPGPSPIDPLLTKFQRQLDQAVDPSKPAVLLKPGLSQEKLHPRIAQLFAGCPKLRLALKHQHQAAKLRQAVSQALHSCGCAVDLASYKAWLNWQLVAVNRAQAKTTVKVVLAGKDDKDVVLATAPAGQTWDKAHLALVQAARKAGGKPVRLNASK